MTTIKRDGTSCWRRLFSLLTVCLLCAVYSALETARDCQVRRPTSTSRPGPPTYRSLPLRRHRHHHHRRRRCCRSSFNSSNCWKDYVLQHAKYPLPKSKTSVVVCMYVCAYVHPDFILIDADGLPAFHSFLGGAVVVVNETETCCGASLLKMLSIGVSIVLGGL